MNSTRDLTLIRGVAQHPGRILECFDQLLVLAPCSVCHYYLRALMNGNMAGGVEPVENQAYDTVELKAGKERRFQVNMGHMPVKGIVPSVARVCLGLVNGDGRVMTSDCGACACGF